MTIIKEGGLERRLALRAWRSVNLFAPVNQLDMKEKRYGYGAWEYRYICKNCGHAVRAPKNEEPCSVCGGDFGPKISVRKLYLEAEKPFETVEVEYPLPKTFFERIKEALGFKVEQRFGVREEKRRPSRRWRWQTHAEVEEESGVVRHEDFI
ncbi:MAG: hypothetical protein II561_07220 [Thermoguttaceae bacterium]|nr:hypothetical protein [Thermoguttaceae bacterium]MBQ2039811.1 hypothetical protein [Thermoguttaceae bacterium]MBQ2556329.1 hypothetical protein [Thermoguttaceae bacterium]MBQ3822685.1 hypothetical protein [Thermoguttaceae bacterium]MBQ4203017.1 hypothetical protein [Thermoguttaceae bacterium]